MLGFVAQVTPTQLAVHVETLTPLRVVARFLAIFQQPGGRTFSHWIVPPHSITVGSLFLLVIARSPKHHEAIVTLDRMPRFFDETVCSSAPTYVAPAQIVITRERFHGVCAAAGVVCDPLRHFVPILVIEIRISALHSFTRWKPLTSYVVIVQIFSIPRCEFFIRVLVALGVPTGLSYL